ncbi:MAG: hypothetical protein OXF98_10950, partial [Rhodospirillaceae bacterium]|nr:hypothetical protein [Rhodospirillaceae bacterium]
MPFPPASGVRLSAESGSGFDLGIGSAAGTGTYLASTGFDQAIEGETCFDLADLSGCLQSAGINRARGIEIAVDERFSAGHLPLDDYRCWMPAQRWASASGWKPPSRWRTRP